METILALAHTESNGLLAKPALEALGAAKALADSLGGSQLIVGLIGADVQAATNLIASCGATRFLGVYGTDFTQARYASDAAAAETLCQAAAASVVIAAGSSRWCRVLSGVTQRLAGRVDTHVTGISTTEGKLSVSRWYYRQRMEATLHRTQRPWVIVLDPGCHAPWKGENGTATCEAITVNLSEACKRTMVTAVQAPPADQQTIRPDAELLFVAGAGWTKKQADGKTHAPEAAVRGICLAPSIPALEWLLRRVGFARVERVAPPPDGHEQLVGQKRAMFAAHVE